MDELYGCCPILKRPEGSSVNIDELDFLAKRLESFGAGEDAKFQGMPDNLYAASNSEYVKSFITLSKVYPKESW